MFGLLHLPCTLTMAHGETLGGWLHASRASTLHWCSVGITSSEARNPLNRTCTDKWWLRKCMFSDLHKSLSFYVFKRNFPVTRARSSFSSDPRWQLYFRQILIGVPVGQIWDARIPLFDPIYPVARHIHNTKPPNTDPTTLHMRKKSITWFHLRLLRLLCLLCHWAKMLAMSPKIVWPFENATIIWPSPFL